jgi:exopolysaccharide biosynthesis polyprenyl glycosylphosphotransferase
MSVTSLGPTSSAPENATLESARPTGADLHVVPDPLRDRRHRRAPLLAGLLAVVTGLLVAVFDGGSVVPTVWAVSWAVAAWVRTVGQRHYSTPRARMRGDVTTAGAFVTAASLAGTLGLMPLPDARGCLVVTLVAAATTLLVRWAMPRRQTARRVVLVGSHQDVEAFATSSMSSDVLLAGCYVLGSGPVAVQPALGVPTTTSLETLPDLVSSVAADEVLVVPGREVDSQVVRTVTWALEDEGVRVGVVCPVASVPSRRLRTVQLGDATVLDLGELGASRLEEVAKSAIDRVGAALLLLLMSPLLVLVAIGVRLDSKGPALFMQTRVGRHGEMFRMFKFRSMHTNADELKEALLEQNEMDGVLFKIRRDPRVTRFGYWLRRSSFDELPQLLNVLLGHMSLVGPRPALPLEVATYDETARRRLVVRPGITGLWQVSGRSDLTWEDALRLDLYYADNWRLVDDFVIAARTFGAVALARGAY